MSFVICVQLTSLGVDAGPFDIYAQTTNGLQQVANNVPGALMLAPATYCVTVPDGTYGIEVRSDNVLCNNVVINPVDLECYCYEISSLTGSNTMKWIDCQDVEQTRTITNSRENVCAKFSTITRQSGTGTAATIVGPFGDCSFDSDCFEAFIMYANGLTRANVSIITSSCPFAVDYGDGVILYYNAGTYNIPAHAYATPFTGEVRILSSNLGCISVLRTDNTSSIPYTGTLTIIGTELIKLTGLTFLNSTTTILNADVSQLPATLVRLVSYQGVLTGNITTTPLPTGLTSITLYDSNTISGNINSFPSGIVTIIISGFNQLSGSMTTFGATHTSVKTIDIQGNTTIGGSISGLVPIIGLLTFRVWGTNTLVGDIANFPRSIQFINVTGWNSLSGNLSGITTCIALKTLYIDNPVSAPGIYGNTITGDIASLPDSLSYTWIRGKNTISGDIADMPIGTGATSVTWLIEGNNNIVGNIANMRPNTVMFYVGGPNTTITGDINTLPSTLVSFYLSGLNTIFGNMGQIPASPLKSFDVTGLNTITGYSGRTWASGMITMVVFSAVNFNDPGTPYNDIDNFLNALAGYTWATVVPGSNVQIKLRGARTAASDSAYATLTGTYGIPVNIIP